jgi:REP element-mobilizing transposase RayT
MPPLPDERRQAIRRFGYAVRSTPAEPPSEKRPGGLVTGSHSRGYLPHVKTEGGTYFVTFRLADSLPREVLAALHAKSSAALKKAADDSAAKRAADREYFRAFEKELDSARGQCWLRRAEIAGLVAGALRHFDHARYRLGAWAVMPNHVHAVLTPLPGATLSAILHSWKSFTAKAANALLPEKAAREFWQRESYDHWCRDEEEVARCVRYVEANPVKAKLCGAAEQWRWSSAGCGGRLEARVTAGGDACATP